MSGGAVLDRVRKLLALATSPNVHEAAAAAAAAQALIEQHRIEGLIAALADGAADPITDGREAPLERGRRLRRWKLVLAAGLADANGCVAYTAEDPSRGDTLLLLVGRTADRAAVSTIWDWLVQRLEWLSATEGPGRSRAWHEAFRIGAADVVVDRLAAVAGAEAPHIPPEALVRVSAAREAERAAVMAYAEQHLRLGPGRGLRVDARGYAAGRAAGARVRLPP